jgi:D-aminoacyl-tRNA deacylase
MPSLLVHCTANWNDKADFGGNPRELGRSSGSAMKIALIELFKQKKDLKLSEFDVNIEVSHHGPTQLQTPLLFVELGSTDKDWKNRKGALAVANAIMKVAKNKQIFKNYIGVGGPHYASKFAKLIADENKNFAVSHIIPKYMLDSINNEMVLQSIDRSVEEVENFVFDWKGMNSSQKEKIISIIESIGYNYKKAKEYKV